jgi:hypothetical protein
VFGNAAGEPVKDIRDDWPLACEAAEITGLHVHALRREFASRLRETPGISDHHVRDWLGHADMATGRYLATTRVGLQQARRVFEQPLAGFAHVRTTWPLKPLRTAPQRPPRITLTHGIEFWCGREDSNLHSLAGTSS